MKSKLPWLTVLALSLLSACARSPDRQYYTLRSSSTVTTPSGVLRQPKDTLAITALSIPENVDTNKIVTRVPGSSRLEISESYRWTESLTAEISTALADDLGQQYPGTLVTTPGQTAAPSHPDHQLEIDITRFDGTLGVGVELEAIWSIRGQKEKVVRHAHAKLNEPAKASDYEALTRAYTAALQRLSILIKNSLDQRP